jgi:hypothetical protein
MRQIISEDVNLLVSRLEKQHIIHLLAAWHRLVSSGFRIEYNFTYKVIAALAKKITYVFEIRT